MKKFYFLILIIILPCGSIAQDMIYFLDGREQQVKVLEVLGNSVRFKPYGTENVHFVSVDIIKNIVFEDGTNISFNNAVVADSTPPRNNLLDNRKILSLNLYELLYSGIEFNYEYILPSGSFGVRPSASYSPDFIPFIPTFFFIARAPDNEGVRRYSLGLSVNYYPYGQEKIAWYIGGSTITGSYEPSNDYGYAESNTTSFSGLAAVTGVYFHRSHRFTWLFEFGLGRMMISDYDGAGSIIWIPAKINIGYKF
jgi:hypothetical protein